MVYFYSGQSEFELISLSDRTNDVLPQEARWTEQVHDIDFVDIVKGTQTEKWFVLNTLNR